MLKRKIKYEDFNGDMVEETFFFNLSQPELIEMEVEYDRGLGTILKEIVESENKKELIGKFKEIILKAYGKRSEDGKRFIKSDELREEFSQTAAYQSFFMELATNDGAAIEFFRGILPANLRPGFDDQTKAIKPPTPPAQG